jgi:hypothetical protein
MPALNFDETAEHIVHDNVLPFIAAMTARDYYSVEWAAETRDALKKAIVDALEEAHEDGYQGAVALDQGGPR